MNLDPIYTTFPVLETKRLLLREPTLQDSDDLFKVYGNAQVMKYIAPVHRTLDETRHMIRQYHCWYVGRGSVRWAIVHRADDKVIGTLGIHAFDTAAERAELGYEMHPDYWRQGIMSEAAHAVLRFSFETVGCKRMEAGTDGPNENSHRLLKRLGFTQEAHFKERINFHGTIVDEYMFGLLRRDYHAP